MNFGGHMVLLLVTEPGLELSIPTYIHRLSFHSVLLPLLVQPGEVS